MQLLAHESTMFMLRLPSVSTVTYYEGKLDDTILRNRVIRIVEKTPWLLGELVNVKIAFTLNIIMSFAILPSKITLLL